MIITIVRGCGGRLRPQTDQFAHQHALPDLKDRWYIVVEGGGGVKRESGDGRLQIAHATALLGAAVAFQGDGDKGGRKYNYLFYFKIGRLKAVVPLTQLLIAPHHRH